jgi:LacI family transcriptional regulator
MMNDTPRRIAIAIEIDEPHRRHQDTFAGIQRYQREHPGWECYIDEHPLDREAAGDADRPAYDGIIARVSNDFIARRRGDGVPTVNVHYQAHRPGIASVLPDPVRTGQDAADHLIALGMPRLCFITDKSHKFFRHVWDAFKQRAAEDGVPCSPSFFKEPAYRNRKGWLKMKREVRDCIARVAPPVGVFVATAPLARVLIQTAQAKRWHVPRDMTVLSGRDLAAVVEVEPKISSIEVDYHRIGYRAARLLDEMLDGKPVPDRAIYVPPDQIKARESTDYRLVNDKVVSQALHYIADHLEDPLTVEGIAYALSVSTRLLQQRFADHLHTGISSEIRRLRLEKAKRLLAEPGRQITSIPKAAGFNSANAMNKVFTRELGMSPSAYRKQILENRLYDKATGNASKPRASVAER